MESMDKSNAELLPDENLDTEVAEGERNNELLKRVIMISYIQILGIINRTPNYQRVLIFLALFCQLGCAFSSYIISYIATDPTPKCQYVVNFLIFLIKSDEKRGTFFKCKEEEACKNLDLNKLEYDYSSWCEKYNLQCNQMNKREQGRTLYYIMNTTTNFVIFLFLDKFGRKVTFYFCGIIFISSVTASCFIDDWFIRMVLMGAANGCEGSFSNFFNVLLNESTSIIYFYFILF